MKIKVTKKTEQEIEIDLPAFWGNENHTEFLAAIDEMTAISIINRPEFKIMQNCELWLKHSDIAEAYKNWISISESEFLEIHESFLQSLSLMPKMVE